MVELGRNVFPSLNSLRESAWFSILRAYLVWTVVSHLVWEVIQLPFYTIWTQETPVYNAFAVLHCTAGDVLIASAALALSLVVAGRGAWPFERFWPVVSLATGMGIGYTIYSEWLNTGVRLAWAYSEWMPVIPVLGTGLSPLMQWLVLPPLGMWVCRRRLISSLDKSLA